MTSLRARMKRSPLAVIVGVCGVVLTWCVFLPWFRIEGSPLNGIDDFPTPSGTRQSPGVPMLLAGLAILASAVVMIVRPTRVAPAVVAVVAGLFGVAAVVWGWLTIAAYVDFEGGGDALQPGLWLASLAAPVAVVAGAIELANRRDA